MAYLITCAGSKRIPQVVNPSSIKNLSFNDSLFEARIYLLELTGIQLDWDKTLPAWKLYSGKQSKLYPKIFESNWLKPNIEIHILSALFGWIRHTDLVPWYNLKMNDKALNNTSIYRIWYNFNVLDKLVMEDDIDLLSQTYRKAIHRSTKPVSKTPAMLFDDYGIKKGIWLNHEISQY